jgi:hypothetical protein
MFTKLSVSEVVGLAPRRQRGESLIIVDEVDKLNVGEALRIPNEFLPYNTVRSRISKLNSQNKYTYKNELSRDVCKLYRTAKENDATVVIRLV